MGLIFGGRFAFKIDLSSLIVGRKFTVFVIEGNFQVQAHGGLIFGGAISRRVFCVTSLGGLIFGGAYFRNFTVTDFVTFQNPDHHHHPLSHLLSPRPTATPRPVFSSAAPVSAHYSPLPPCDSFS